MNVTINYFDPSQMKPGAVVLIIGRRGSGKSTVAADILSYHKDAQRGICISGTERVNPFWAQYIPQCFIHYEYADEITKKLFKMQKECKKALGYVEKAFAIYDDCMFDKRFIRSRQTREIFMNGRHSNVFTIVTAQWIMDVPPDLRANVDYVIALQDNVAANRERIHRCFAGVFDTFRAFDKTMQACTVNREAMVIDQGCLSYNVSDSVYFYKATPNLRYRLGAEEYWTFSQKAADKKGEDGSDEEEAYEAPEKRVKVKKKYPTYSDRYNAARKLR